MQTVTDRSESGVIRWPAKDRDALGSGEKLLGTVLELGPLEGINVDGANIEKLSVTGPKIGQLTKDAAIRMKVRTADGEVICLATDYPACKVYCLLLAGDSMRASGTYTTREGERVFLATAIECAPENGTTKPKTRRGKRK